MGFKKILEKKYLNKKILTKIIWLQKNLLSKMFWPDKTKVKNYFGTIQFGQKNFWLENFLVPKIVGWTNSLSENSVSEKFSVKKIMVVQKIWVNLQTPSRPFQTSSRHPPDTLKTPFRRILETLLTLFDNGQTCR